jgi:hypothetical protein
LFFHLIPYLEASPLYSMCLADPNKVNKPNVIIPAYLAPADYSRINEGGGSVNFAVNLRLWQTAGLSNLQAPVLPAYVKAGFPQKVRMPATFNPDGASNTFLFATKMQVCGANASTLINSPPALTPGDPTTGAVTNVANVNGPYFGWTYAAGSRKSEPAVGLGWQMAPMTANCTANCSLAQGFYSSGIQVALCDASVFFVTKSTSIDVWTKALTPNGGESFREDWEF